MAIKYNERYPGRSLAPSTRYPQGGFKNRSAPDAKDGTYLEQDWANDISGFLQWLLAKAGIVANGSPDDAINSQYADALKKLVDEWITDGATDVVQIPGTSTSSVMSQNAVTYISFGQNQGMRYGTGKKLNTSYTNNTGKPQMVYVTCLLAPQQGVSLLVNGNQIAYASNVATSGNTQFTVSSVVGNGETVRANSPGQLAAWWEF